MQGTLFSDPYPMSKHESGQVLTEAALSVLFMWVGIPKESFFLSKIGYKF